MRVGEKSLQSSRGGGELASGVVVMGSHPDAVVCYISSCPHEPAYQHEGLLALANNLHAKCEDPRVRGWLLLDSCTPTLVLTFIYLLIVYFGPKYMKNKMAYSLKNVLLLYNFGVTLLSFYMLVEIQFILTITHTLSAVFFPCGFPLRCLLFQSSYMVSLVILFINFYMQTYRKQPGKGGKAKEIMRIHTNGISSSDNGAKHKKQ
ncbi:Elongation of very long chain fatty acids protein 2 [Bagarius yarrelli]|uniref:Elongation of very long chain fatty acids protein n=1 Tax=Bagarius yarrelli TaxID=175774 RepID=A0A556V1S6_BAGYA|nr:Elongation of very long chain fatty acids protein 2 [Bagarius yarrelli]